MSATKMKVAVTERALFARVNRQLAKDGQTLRTSRSAAEKANAGNYFVLDAAGNITAHHINDLEKWVRKEFDGMLKPYETLEG